MVMIGARGRAREQSGAVSAGGYTAGGSGFFLRKPSTNSTSSIVLS